MFALIQVSASPALADEGDVSAARARVRAAVAAYEESHAEASRLEDEVARFEAELASIRARYDVLAATMGEIAVQRYVQFGAGMSVLGEADIYRAARSDALARLATRQSQDQSDRFKALRQDLAIRQSNLEKRLAQQRQIDAELDEDAARLRRELANLEELERERIAAAEREAVAEAARRAAAAGSPSGSGGGGSGAGGSGGGGSGAGAQFYGSGTVACPVPTGSDYADTWGDPRSGGRSHKGVDMFAPHGRPVVAVVSGNATDNTGGAGGIAIFLYGDDGNTYYYAHLQDIAALGQVGTGQLIGWVGSSGNADADAPHLHFEVHPGGGGAVNPYPFVAARC